MSILLEIQKEIDKSSNTCPVSLKGIILNKQNFIALQKELEGLDNLSWDGYSPKSPRQGYLRVSDIPVYYADNGIQLI